MPSKTISDTVRELEQEVRVLKERLANMAEQFERTDIVNLVSRVGILDDRVNELKRAREESDRRVWNVLMIAVGAVLSLLGGVVVQLVAFGLRK